MLLFQLFCVIINVNSITAFNHHKRKEEKTMSKNHVEKIKCPKCSHECDFTVWENVNTSDDLELKELVRSRKAFTCTCPECGNEAVILYPMYYYQPESNILIHFIPEYSDAAVNFIKELKHEPYDESKPLAENCRKRIVFNPNQFLEKLLITDEKLDDRVVELMKLFIIAEIMKKDSDHKINEIYLNKEQNGALKFAILFNNGEWGRTEFIRADYDLIVKKFTVDLLTDTEVSITTKWAMSVLNKKL